MPNKSGRARVQNKPGKNGPRLPVMSKRRTRVFKRATPKRPMLGYVRKSGLNPQRTPTSHLSIYDPFNPLPVPVVNRESNALPITGLVRYNWTPTSNRRLFVIGNTGKSATVMAQLELTGATPTITASSCSTFNASATAGGPTSARSMKVGFELVNWASLNQVGGVVYILPARQRMLLPGLPSTMVLADWQTLTGTTIVGHPDTLAFAAGDFIKPMRFFSWPVDLPDYNDFAVWDGTEGVDVFFSHCATWPGLTTPLPRTMNFYWVVIEGVATNPNNYSFSIKSSYYTRWPLNTVPSLIESEPPVSTTAQSNAQQAMAEAVGGNGTTTGIARKVIDAAGVALDAVNVGGVGLTLGAAAANRMARMRRDQNGFL